MSPCNFHVICSHVLIDECVQVKKSFNLFIIKGQLKPSRGVKLANIRGE